MRSSRSMLCVPVVGLMALGSLVSPETRKAADEPFHKELLKVAAEYKAWGRVDDEWRWAPGKCDIPHAGTVRESTSKDDRTHGRKLYSLFARQRNDYYFATKNTPAAVGQVVVKQSWTAQQITDPKEKPVRRFDQTKMIRSPNPRVDPKRSRLESLDDHFYPYFWNGTKVFKATKQTDLFIMMKLDPKTPDTDAGWVYATTTPDGKTVTAAGKIESCMKCHQEAKNDRLFGLWR